VPLPRATAISAGFTFSLAISEGRVYSWGHNSYGQLGSGGEEEHRTRPGLVSGVSEATAISAGYTHAAALTNGPAGRPTIEAVPGRRSLTINWEAAASPETWYLAYRPIEQPQAPWTSVKLEPKARTFTITGLQPRRYEVVVRQLHSAFGARIIEGTPS